MRITKLNQIEYFPSNLRMRLQTLGEFVDYNDSPDREQAIQRLSNTDVAIVEWYTNIDREMLESSRHRLKHIVVPLTDYSHVDVQSAMEFGITIANCPNTSTSAVAEHLFALLGAVNRKLILADRLVREGKRDYYDPFLAIELDGKILGILGVGHIGQWAAKIALGYGMKIIGSSRSPKKIPNIEDVKLETLFKESDVLFITVPSTLDSRQMVSKQHLLSMKPSSFLISISNKEIIDEQALYECIENGQIRGAGLDQLEIDSPLVNSDKVVFSPGTAWLTEETFKRLFDAVYRDVESFIQGAPENLATLR